MFEPINRFREIELVVCGADGVRSDIENFRSERDVTRNQKDGHGKMSNVRQNEHVSKAFENY